MVIKEYNGPIYSIIWISIIYYFSSIYLYFITILFLEQKSNINIKQSKINKKPNIRIKIKYLALQMEAISKEIKVKLRVVTDFH